MDSVFRIPEISHRRFLTVFPDSQPQSGKNQLANKVPPLTFVATLGRYFVMDGLAEITSHKSLLVCVRSSIGSEGYNMGYTPVRKDKEPRSSGD